MDKRVDKFRKMADDLQRQIDERRRPLTQNPTPKRMSEYKSRVHDGNNLERTQQALRALADRIERGDLPQLLSDIKTKKDVEPLVYKSTLNGGYYDCIPDPAYRDKSAKALEMQALLEASLSGEDLAKREENAKKQRIEAMQDRIRFIDVDGFFPTPRATVERMIDLAMLEPGQMILEPSAGIGSIVDGIRERKGSAYDSLIEVVELRPTLCDILKEKGYEPVNRDFMEWQPILRFDRILMNPPFENGQDAEHVMRAFDFLSKGGRLVAIVSAGPFYRQDRKSEEFRGWLSCVGAEIEDLPDDWCKGSEAFRNTGVKACIVMIDKMI